MIWNKNRHNRNLTTTYISSTQMSWASSCAPPYGACWPQKMPTKAESQWARFQILFFQSTKNFKFILRTHMHMYTTYMQNFTWSYFYMQRTKKRQIHIFKLAFHFCYWAGIFYFVQHTNYNIFHEISQVLAEYIYVSVVFFQNFFELLNMFFDIFKTRAH